MSEEPHADQPLLGLAACLCAGALVGGEAQLDGARLLLLLSAGLLALANLPKAASRAGLALAAAAFGLGAAGRALEAVSYQNNRLHRFVTDQGASTPLRISGTLVLDAWHTRDRTILVVDVDRIRAGGREQNRSGRARVQVADAGEELEASRGDRVVLWASLRPPRGYRTPGAFDAEGVARGQGVHAVGFSKSRLLVESSPGAGRSLGEVVGRLRRQARRLISDALPAGEEQALVRAMVVGDRTGVDDETAEVFRIAGTYHVLALSGAQVALVAGLLWWAFRWLPLGPAASALGVALAVCGYALFVGGETPVVRAAIMVAVVACGRALELHANLPNLLGLAAGGVVVAAPSAISDVSFQLSFGATLAILLLSPRIAAALGRWPAAARWGIAGSLAAQAALLPLLAAHFHRLAPAALLLNLAAGPLAGAVLIAGFALVAVAALLPAAALVPAAVAWGLAHALLVSAEVVRRFPALDLRAAAPEPVAWAFWAAALVLCSKGRLRPAAVAFAVCCAALVAGPAPRADGRLHVTVLDVGQGDAIVLRSPRGRALLVDAGPRRDPFDAGEAVVAPYLWSVGVRSLEALVLTHADGDHVGGARFLTRVFSPRAIWEGPAPLRDPRQRALERDLEAQGVARLTLRSGGALDWEGVFIEVVTPRSTRSPARSGNDESVVLRVRYRGVSFLLTGDLTGAGEAHTEVGVSDVLKVGHHGSRTSSSSVFLRRVRPRLALISVGERNSFGHPHTETLERLMRLGAVVRRTDRDGTIDVATDGSVLEVATPGSWADSPLVLRFPP